MMGPLYAYHLPPCFPVSVTVIQFFFCLNGRNVVVIKCFFLDCESYEFAMVFAMQWCSFESLELWSLFT